MFYPSSAVQNCRKHLTNCLSRDNFVSCTCGILLIHIINKEGCRMKCPITGTVWGNMGNATNHIVLCYTRLNNRYKRAQTFQNLASLIICTLSHSRLLAAIRPERRVTRRETTPLSACAPDNTASTHTHVHMYVIQSYEQCGLSSSCQIAMHTCPHTHTHTHTHTQVSLLFQKFPVLVFSAWGCVFFFVCRNSCLHSPFPPNRAKENKNIMKGLKEITGCQSSETQTVCVCVCVCEMCMCFYRGLKHANACLSVSACMSVHRGCVWAHMCHIWEIWQNLSFPPACPDLITEEWTQTTASLQALAASHKVNNT